MARQGNLDFVRDFLSDFVLKGQQAAQFAIVFSCPDVGLVSYLDELGSNPHSLGIAITGGYVYHGYRTPFLTGAYIYGDYGSGRIWMLRYVNGAITADSLLIQAPFAISSFGTDQLNELYIVSYSGLASIYRFAGPGPTSIIGPASLPASFALDQNYPNPFNPATSIGYRTPGSAHVRLRVFDIL